MRKRLLSVLLSFAVLFSYTPTFAEDFDDAYYYDTIDTYNVNREIPTYNDYTSKFPQKFPNDIINIQAADFASYTDKGESAIPERMYNYVGMHGSSILTSEDSVIKFKFNVDEEGFYAPYIDYFAVEGRNSAIQRAVFIDDKLPAKEFSVVQMRRSWQPMIQAERLDENGVTVRNWHVDNQGNDIAPIILERHEWQGTFLYDPNGFITDELVVYLTKGEHTITFVALREAMLIRSITFFNDENPLEYDVQKAIWDSAGLTETHGHVVRIEAENASRMSSQTIHPLQDYSDPLVYPSSPKYLKNNSIGGEAWSGNNWIEWVADVPESGYYNMSLHVKQNFRNSASTRRIFIDGLYPFAETMNIGFRYQQGWYEQVLSDENKNPYLIYLEKGEHTIRMDCALGDFAEILSSMKDIVYDLNNIYRSVIRITGVNPDKYRDYQLERSLPELKGQLTAARDEMDIVLNELSTISGSERVAVLSTMRDQLNALIDDPELFSKTTRSFRINMRACGTWSTQILSSPLQLDTIYLYSPDSKPYIEKTAWYKRFAFELKRLFYSFFVNYDKLGDVTLTPEAETITMWMGAGRDQASDVKTIINEKFTVQHGINVNVVLVDMNTLLEATLSGQGPDIAIQVAPSVPMDYGVRSAVVDLSTFPDIDKVLPRFFESAITQFEYDGHVYGLPETQTFPMMFYRKDILRELGVSPPETWDDVKKLMTVFAQKQMEFGMSPTESVFSTILYQNGGDYYSPMATRSALDSENAVNAFKTFCGYYTDYRIDKSASVEDRFRTGECPVIITDYTFYNTLQVSAPDIQGVWGFAPVPATIRPDGTLDRTVASQGSAAIILNASKHKNASWEFLKWWTSDETQAMYSVTLESVMGAPARVATANKGAFENLQWLRTDYEALKKQVATAKAIRQVPGGYFSFRNVNNAFYLVTEDIDAGISAKEALTDKVMLINNEITYKRSEFGMPLTE
ncbi:ABC transporter substrate-binding protein [Clostridia bacterium]|nr:ABC transporter substrate-binding protein [Clostridia bacterium]